MKHALRTMTVSPLRAARASLARRAVSILLGTSVSLGALALAPAARAADKPRYTKQEVEVKATTQTNLTKPVAPPKDKKQTGPVLTIDQFVEKKQGQIQQIVDKQIAQMQRLLRVTDDGDPQKPDFYFRLAELYAEKQRYFDFQARGLDQKIYDAPAGAKQTLTRQQQDYDKKSEQYLLEAVKSYRAATEFKKYERMDEVLFKLAYLLQTVKKEDLAREYFHRLIKDYPNSKYVPDAYLSFGEFYFQKGEMDAALKFYERVEQFPKSPVYGYAIYKKGWCWVNLGDYKKALEVFVGVVRLAQEGKGGNKAQNQALEREAKKDIVKAYARVGTAEKAWEFFQRTGGDYAPKMMEGLGEIYWEQGMFVESTKVYRKIIATNPESPRICEWQNKILRNTLSSSPKRDQVQELERLGNVYDRVAKMQGVKAGAMEECKNSFHDTAKELALIWHKEAQKTKNPDTYALTKLVYKEYLDHFAGEKGSEDMQFYYAEVLWVTEDWRNAAEAYTKFVEQNPKHKDAKEAAYAAVLAWKNALNIDDQGPPPETKGDKGNKFAPITIPEHQKKFISALDTYIKYVPDSPDLVKIKYRKARIFYEYNHFDEAVTYFEDIVEHHSKDELAIYSANLLLDSLNIQGKHKEVVKWVDKFVEMPELMKDQEFQKQMVSIKTDSYVLEAKDYEKHGDFKNCGISMLAAAESMPEHPQHATRLFDAGVCFQNARLIGQAIAARDKLIQLHPKDPLAQRALFQIASGYHQLAWYSRAADNYEKFATQFPGEKEAPTALGNAYQFRVGMGEYDKAIDNMNNFVKFYGSKKPQDAATVFFQMGEVYEKQNQTDELAKHLTAYLKTWGDKGGVDKQIVAHFKLGEILWKKSCPKEGLNGACIEITRSAASGRAQAIQEINKKIKDKRKKIKDKLATQCGPATKNKITVFERNKNVAKEAQGHFATALKLFNHGEALKKVQAKDAAEAQARTAAAQYAAAGSAFYGAEEVYEEFLRVKFPNDLDFQRPTQYDSKRKAEAKKKKLAESEKKFKGYLDEKAKFTTRLAGEGKSGKGMYDSVFDFKVAHWTIAAAARVGQVWQNFADQLYTAEIPKDLKEMDEWGNRPREIYCDALTDQAEPLETKAVTGFQVCLRGATEQSWFNDWSHLCEVELNQMQPTEYPLAAEARPEPGYMSVSMVPAPVVTELPASAKTPVITSQR